MIEIKINTAELESRLNEAAAKISNTRPLMGDMARIMRNAVIENFEAGGRPAWKARISGGSHALLQKSSRLKDSIKDSHDSNNAIVGTNVEYAAIHHFGGQTSPSSYMRKRTKSFGRFLKRVNHPGSKIPARPFMVLQPDDEQALVDAVNDYLDAALGN